MSSDQSEKPGSDRSEFARRFERVGEVSRGGVGVIEAAHDQVIHRTVAIKVLQREHNEDPVVAGKFAGEGQITGQLDHPNIVPVYDIGEDADGPFIVMKLIRGQSLSEILSAIPKEADSSEGLQDLVKILLKLCDALSFAHSRGVIHCDLKPDNVMVGQHGEVYLMDWGVAWLIDEERVLEGVPPSQRISSVPASDHALYRHSRIRTTANPESAHFRGTPAYMAPEQLQARSDRIDERTDVFGMGAVLYEILTGDPPNDRGRLLGPALSLQPVATPLTSKRWAQLPPGLCQIAIKALAPRREDRYQSVLELRAELEQFLLGGGWFERRSIAAGQPIVSEGEAGDSAYIIEVGACEVFKNIQGERVVLRQLGAGDVFGETAVLTGAPRTASVVAVTDVTLRVITGDSLNRELDRNPWLAAFVRSLAALFREADAARSHRPPAAESTAPDAPGAKDP